jgi:T4 RnlA family RNA ligase
MIFVLEFGNQRKKKMKISLQDIDLENFFIKEGQIAGETCYLVQPNHIGCQWNKQNLIFRSSIWNKDGELISASYKKFFNWGEQPDLTYTPFSVTANGGIMVLDKIDGSTLIISKYKGELIIRTRGTFDAKLMEKNGHEVDIILEKYPQLNNVPETESWVFEWVSPLNKIVLQYDEADIILTNIIQHSDYSYTKQKELDIFAHENGFLRPDTFIYSSIKELLEDVAQWTDKEGVCVYCKGDQEIRKIKSSWYLSIHKLKSELGSIEKLIDFYFESECPNYSDTYNLICETIDFEIAEFVKGDLSKICDAMREVKKIIDNMSKIVHDEVSKLKTRKEQAEMIVQKWGKTNRASFVFLILDGKELQRDNYKKLLYQVLK